MITIEPTTKIARAEQIHKNKKTRAKEKFQTIKKSSAANTAKVATNNIESANMAFLQEIDQKHEDQEKLKHFSKFALHKLRLLQLELINGNLSERCLHNLHDALNHNLSIYSPEINEIIQEVKLRIAVEIAKIEQGKYLVQQKIPNDEFTEEPEIEEDKNKEHEEQEEFEETLTENE
jgi:hypothetical protein